MVILAIVSALFVAASLKADDELVLRTADITYKAYTGSGTDELIYPRTHTSELNLYLDVKLLQFFYFRSTVFGLSDTGQFRAVGLNYHIGLPLWKYLDVEYEHYSKHLIDATSSTLPGYPLYDSINVIFHLIPGRD